MAAGSEGPTAAAPTRHWLPARGGLPALSPGALRSGRPLRSERGEEEQRG